MNLFLVFCGFNGVKLTDIAESLLVYAVRTDMMSDMDGLAIHAKRMALKYLELLFSIDKCNGARRLHRIRICATLLASFICSKCYTNHKNHLKVATFGIQK
jgi:hypothetical protein